MTYRALKYVIIGMVMYVAAWCIYGVAYAKQMDEFNKLHPVARCQQMSMVYKEGIMGRNEGFGRDIANLDETLLPKWKAGEWKPEHDKMYVFGWDKLDEDVQELFTALAQMGWDHADEVIKSELARLALEDPEFAGKSNAYLDNGKTWHMQNQFLQSCIDKINPDQLEMKDTNFIKTASSDKPGMRLKADVLRMQYCLQSLYRWEREFEGDMEKVASKFNTCVAVPCVGITDKDLGIDQ